MKTETTDFVEELADVKSFDWNAPLGINGFLYTIGVLACGIVIGVFI